MHTQQKIDQLFEEYPERHAGEDDNDFTLFIRSATNFEEFSRADKHVVAGGLSQPEAHAACKNFNDNRTEEEIELGTKMEYTACYVGRPDPEYAHYAP